MTGRPFSVWAPRARRVRVEIGGVLYDLEHAADGHHALTRAALRHGATYRLVLDDGEPLPDPRSPWQPDGVHGASRALDHDAFHWTDAGWRPPPWGGGIVYELHVGTFSPAGTFDGVIERLDHLTDLGVTHVELMPVNAFPGRRNWGYDGALLYAPQESYGGPAGLKRLVDACHARGLAVLLDVVYNHLGPEGNYLDRFGPYFTERYVTPWGKALNLDGPGSDHVRRFFCDNARMWMKDYHVDGLRLDAVHAIIDTSAVHLLEQLAEETEALAGEVGRNLVLVAESDLNDPRVVRSRELCGYGNDAQWLDDLHHALHACLTGERDGYYQDFGPLADVARSLTRAYVVDGRPSSYRGRRHGRPAMGLSGHRFVAFLQTHDQVGNRAQGERLGHLVGEGPLKAALALVMTAPFVPMWFQGEEWNASTPFLYFTDHGDAELGKAVREGRRREFAAFGWNPDQVPDPQAEDTFRRSRLDWDEREREPHRDVLAWYRALAKFRRGRPELLDGRLDRVDVRFDEEARWLALRRGGTTVVVNFGGAERAVPVDQEATAVLLASREGIRVGGGVVRIPAEAAVILGPA